MPNENLHPTQEDAAFKSLPVWVKPVVNRIDIKTTLLGSLGTGDGVSHTFT